MPKDSNLVNEDTDMNLIMENQYNIITQKNSNESLNCSDSDSNLQCVTINDRSLDTGISNLDIIQPSFMKKSICSSQRNLNTNQSNVSSSKCSINNAYSKLLSCVKIKSDLTNMEFHQPKCCKDMLIIKELEKLKGAFIAYKNTKAFLRLYNKIVEYEKITTYVYHQPLINYDKKFN